MASVASIDLVDFVRGYISVKKKHIYTPKPKSLEINGSILHQCHFDKNREYGARMEARRAGLERKIFL